MVKKLKNVRSLSLIPQKRISNKFLRDELNVWTETSQNNEKHRRVNRKSRSCNFPVQCGGTIFSKKPKLGRYRNFKPNFKRFFFVF